MTFNPFRVWLKKQFARPLAARPRRRRHPETIQALEPRCLLAAQLEITPITWNVIGLDSNTAGWDKTTGTAVGPNVFLVGANITNTGTDATDLAADFVWDDAADPHNTFIGLAGGSLQHVALGNLAHNESRLVFFNVEVARDTSGAGAQSNHFSQTLGNTTASDPATTRRYHLTASAKDGPSPDSPTVSTSTPTGRELYVEHLLSQSRNGVRSITGPTEVERGKSYDFYVDSFTATEGYQELQDELVFPNQIFHIDKIEAVYAQPILLTTPALGTTTNPNPTVFANPGLWDDNPSSPNYRSPTNTNNKTNRAGGDPIRTKYTVTVVGEGEARIVDTIRDYSGSSFHYNSDWGKLVHTVVSATADLSIVKDDGATVAIPGSTVTYTFTVGNAGPTSVNGAVVNDLLPAGTSFVSGSTGVVYDPETRSLRYVTGTLPKDGMEVFTVTLSLDPSLTGTLSNSATVTPPPKVTDPDPSNNTDDDIDTLTPQVDVGVTKTDGSPTAIPGSTTTYDIVVTNFGPSTANNVLVTDSLPDNVSGASWTGNDTSGTGPLSNTIATLLPGQSVTYKYTVSISPSALGSLTNIATVSAANDTTPGNNSAIDVDTLTPVVDVGVTKDDFSPTAIAGSTTTYTVVVTNIGPSTATDIAVVDTLPSFAQGVSWIGSDDSSGTGPLTTAIKSLLPGKSVTYTYIVSIDPSATGELKNVVTVSASNDEDSSNNTASDTDTLTRQVDVSVSKSDHTDTAVPGKTTTYDIVVKNLGLSTATDIQVTDTLPEFAFGVSWSGSDDSFGTGPLTTTIASLLPGASVTYTYVVQIDPSALSDLTNLVTVIAADDIVPGNNTAIDIDTLDPDVDVTVAKTDYITTAVPGKTTTYDIVVTNLGSSTAFHVSVKDAIPDKVLQVSWSGNGSSGMGALDSVIDSLLPGKSVVFTSTVLIDPAATGTLINTVTVDAPNNANDDNNTAVDTDMLTPEVDLSIIKDDGHDTIVPGTNNTYTILVANKGPSSVTGATVTDVLPIGTTFVSTTASQYSLVGNNFTYTTGTLGMNDIESFTITLAINAGLTGSLTNAASVTTPSGVTDTDLDNNTDDDVDTLTPQVDLSITKDDGTTLVVPGTSTTYTILVANAGPSSVTGATVTDILPTGTTFVSGSAGVSYNNGSRTVSYVTGTLSPTGSEWFTITVAIDASLTGSLKNIATVTASNGATDTNPANDSDDDVDTLTPKNNVGITKTDGRSVITAGSTTTYTIVVSNAGLSTATAVAVSDPVPAGVTAVSWSGNGSTGTGPLNATINSLLPGASVTFTYTVTLSASAVGSLTNVATVSAANDTDCGNNKAEDVDAIQNGKTLGYYSNKNGQTDLTGSSTGTILKSKIYDALFGTSGVLKKDSTSSVLVKADGSYLSLADCSFYSKIQSFLLNASATNMANMLSAQLLATEFNILLGRIDPTLSVKISTLGLSTSQQTSLTSRLTVTDGGITIQSAINAAIVQLKANPSTVTSSSNRTFQEALKNIFDALNNNRNVFF